jgi:hypothetical protein
MNDLQFAFRQARNRLMKGFSWITLLVTFVLPSFVGAAENGGEV